MERIQTQLFRIWTTLVLVARLNFSFQKNGLIECFFNMYICFRVKIKNIYFRYEIYISILLLHTTLQILYIILLSSIYWFSKLEYLLYFVDIGNRFINFSNFLVSSLNIIKKKFLSRVAELYQIKSKSVSEKRRKNPKIRLTNHFCDCKKKEKGEFFVETSFNNHSFP